MPSEPTTETEEEIVERVLKLKTNYEQSQKDSKAEFAEIYNAFMGKLENVTPTAYDAKENIPKLRTLIAYIKPFIFSGDPEVEVEGIGDEDKDMAMVYEKMINHRFRTIPMFTNKIEAWVGQAVAFGVSVLKVNWEFDTKQEVGENGEVYEKPTRDEPDVEVPSILDVYYNPILPEVDEQVCLIFRSVLPLDHVKQEDMYDYVNSSGELNREILESSGSMKTSPYDSSSLMKIDIPDAQQKATEGMVEVFEHISKDEIITIANGKVLRKKKNPYGFINAVKNIFEQNVVPNRFDGLGTGQNIGDLNKLLFKMFNQAKMNVTLGNNPMFMFKKGSNIDKRHLVSRPGGAVEVEADGPLADNIQAIQFPDLKQGFTELLNLVDDEIKRASGANDIVQGSASNDTLGQDELAQSNINSRFEIIIRRFKHDLARVADMMLQMEIQNLQSPEADILRIFPQEMRVPIFQAIQQTKGSIRYDISIKGDTNVAQNKALASKRLVELLQLLAPYLSNKEIRSFGRKIAEKQGMNDIDELIAEDNPLMDQQEQMSAMPQQPAQ